MPPPIRIPAKKVVELALPLWVIAYNCISTAKKMKASSRIFRLSMSLKFFFVMSIFLFSAKHNTTSTAVKKNDGRGNIQASEPPIPTINRIGSSLNE